jgi:hypothetical protein
MSEDIRRRAVNDLFEILEIMDITTQPEQAIEEAPPAPPEPEIAPEPEPEPEPAPAPEEELEPEPVPEAAPITVEQIDQAANDIDRGDLFVQKGNYHVPGLRQSDQEQAGQLAYVVEKGEASLKEWNEWVESAKREGRFTDKEALIREPVQIEEKPEREVEPEAEVEEEVPEGFEVVERPGEEVEEEPGPASEEESIKRATHMFEGAEKRWAKRREKGLTDNELKDVLSEEFGAQGGDADHTHWGGKNPRIVFKDGRKLSGKRLLSAVREVLGIPTPKKEAIVKPKPEPEKQGKWDRERVEQLRELQKADAVEFNRHVGKTNKDRYIKDNYNIIRGDDGRYRTERLNTEVPDIAIIEGSFKTKKQAELSIISNADHAVIASYSNLMVRMPESEEKKVERQRIIEEQREKRRIKEKAKEAGPPSEGVPKPGKEVKPVEPVSEKEIEKLVPFDTSAYPG